MVGLHYNFSKSKNMSSEQLDIKLTKSIENNLIKYININLFENYVNLKFEKISLLNDSYLIFSYKLNNIDLSNIDFNNENNIVKNTCSFILC